MTLALLEEPFRTFRTTIVHSHSQLHNSLDSESLVVPYLANLVASKKGHSRQKPPSILLNNTSVAKIPIYFQNEASLAWVINLAENAISSNVRCLNCMAV